MIPLSVSQSPVTDTEKCLQYLNTSNQHPEHVEISEKLDICETSSANKSDSQLFVKPKKGFREKFNLFMTRFFSSKFWYLSRLLYCILHCKDCI